MPSGIWKLWNEPAVVSAYILAAGRVGFPATLEGMRRFRVKGFENFLVFYLPGREGIDVVRVLHGARDIVSIFADEEDGV